MKAVLLIMIACSITGMADETVLRGTIVRINYSRRDPVDHLQLQIRALVEHGFEISWVEPEEIKHGYVWWKTESWPWVKLKARAVERDNEAIQRILKL